MHTFYEFAVSLQSRFYISALIFVFNVNIYSSGLRLFKIDPAINLLPEIYISTILHLTVVFAVTLALGYICFKYLDPVKKSYFSERQHRQTTYP